MTDIEKRAHDLAVSLTLKTFDFDVREKALEAKMNESTDVFLNIGSIVERYTVLYKSILDQLSENHGL